MRGSLKALKALEIPHVTLHSDGNAAFSLYVVIGYDYTDLHREEMENAWWMSIITLAHVQWYSWATIGELAAGRHVADGLS